jgi:hypothetical protein
MSEYTWEFPTEVPATPAVTTVEEGETDHVADALERLPEQFRSDENVIALLTALVRPAQELETALQALLLERSVSTAEGTQLDIIGKLVNQSRNGLADDVYRRYIRARIKANRSNGTVEDLIRVAVLVIDDVDARIVVDQQGTAGVVVQVADITVDDDLADAIILFLRLAVSAGVRVILESSGVDETASFTFQNGVGQGFGKAERVDLSGFTTNVDTVVRKRHNGGTPGYDTLTLVHSAGAPNNGVLSQAPNGFGIDYTFTFKGGTTTVANFETAINASEDLHVYTSDGVGTMTAGVDEISGAGFGIGGSNGGIAGGQFVGARE